VNTSKQEKIARDKSWRVAQLAETLVLESANFGNPFYLRVNSPTSRIHQQKITHFQYTWTKKITQVQATVWVKKNQHMTDIFKINIKTKLRRNESELTKSLFAILMIWYLVKNRILSCSYNITDLSSTNNVPAIFEHFEHQPVFHAGGHTVAKYTIYRYPK